MANLNVRNILTFFRFFWKTYFR